MNVGKIISNTFKVFNHCCVENPRQAGKRRKRKSSAGTGGNMNPGGGGGKKRSPGPQGMPPSAPGVRSNVD